MFSFFNSLAGKPLLVIRRYVGCFGCWKVSLSCPLKSWRKVFNRREGPHFHLGHEKEGERNLMAGSCLTMAFSDDALLNIVEQSDAADWPSGLAHIVIDELFKKYRPVDIISRVKMLTKLSQVRMKNEEDPRVLFSELASIQSAYNNTTRKIDQDGLIAVVLEKAPEKYKSIQTAEQRIKGATLRHRDLNSCMNDLYRTIQSSKANTKTKTLHYHLSSVSLA
jgi:hypothetical protein